MQSENNTAVKKRAPMEHSILDNYIHHSIIFHKCYSPYASLCLIFIYLYLLLYSTQTPLFHSGSYSLSCRNKIRKYGSGLWLWLVLRASRYGEFGDSVIYIGLRYMSLYVCARRTANKLPYNLFTVREHS